VSFSEMMSLGDLHAYIRLPGKFPITSIDLHYKHREKRNNGFMLRHFDESKMKEVGLLIEECEKQYANLQSVEKQDVTDAVAQKNNTNQKKEKS